MKIQVDLTIVNFCLCVEEYQTNHYGNIDKQHGYSLWKKLSADIKEELAKEGSLDRLYRGHDIYFDQKWYAENYGGKTEPIMSFTPNKNVAIHFGGPNAVRTFKNVVESYEGSVDTRKLVKYMNKHKIKDPNNSDYGIDVGDDEGEILVFGVKLK